MLVQLARHVECWAPCPGNMKHDRPIAAVRTRRQHGAESRVSSAPHRVVARRSRQPPADAGTRVVRPSACRRRRRTTRASMLRRCDGQVACRRVQCRLRLRRQREQLPAAARDPTVHGSGASSSTTCALVPPKPNELTPARRGTPSVRGHGVRRAFNAEGAVREIDVRVRSLEVHAGGSSPCRRASAVLMRPAIPAAASKCPRFDFTSPRRAVVPLARRQGRRG